MIVDLKAVTVKDGDILLLSGGTFTEAFVRHLDGILKGRGYDCLLVYAPDGGELRALSDEEARAKGWQRVDVPEGEAAN